MELLLKLSGTTLGKTMAKKSNLEFLVGGKDIVGLAELIDAGLGKGLLNNDPEFGITHGRVNSKLWGSYVRQVSINSGIVDVMLFDGNNGAPLYLLVDRLLQSTIALFLCMRGTMWLQRI